MESPTLSSTVLGTLEAGDIISTVSEEAASAFAVVMTGSEGGPVAGREDSGSPALAAEEPSGTKGNDGRNSDGMGRGAMPDKFRGGKVGRGGKPGFPSSGKPTPGMMCGAGRLKLGRLGRLGRLGIPDGKGIRPE